VKFPWSTHPYITTDEGFLYLAGIEDLFQRKVVGWSLGDRITKELTISSLEQAVGRENPEEGLIFHSDRGSQYAAYVYQEVLVKYCIRQSMSRKGEIAMIMPVWSPFFLL